MRNQTSSQSLTRLALAVLLVSTPVAAGSMSLEWDALPEASGYKLYYGDSPGNYTAFEDVGNQTQWTLQGLDDCEDYYVAVKAYNFDGESGTYSNEVSGWGRPEISDFSPSQVDQGDQLTVNIDGANFASGADLLFEIEGLPKVCMNGNNVVGGLCTDDDDCAPNTCRHLDLVRLENVSVSSCNRLQALLTVEPTTGGQRAMEVGDFTVNFEVQNPDAVYGVGSDTLTVELAEDRVDISQAYPSTVDRIDGWDHNWWASKHDSCMIPASLYKPCPAGKTDRYDPDWDLDGDGWVDGDELADIAARFGECWNGSSWSDQACN